MKERAAAIGVLVYAFLLFGWVCWGAVLGRSFNLMTIPIYAVFWRPLTRYTMNEEEPNKAPEPTTR